MSRPALVRIGLALAAALLVRSSAAADEAQVLADRWDETRIGGARAGWSHTVVRKTPEAGGARIETAVEGRIEMARLGAKMVIEVAEVTVEREDGGLVSIRKSTKMSGTETLVEVTFADAQATIATTTLGQRREAKVDVPAGTVGPWRAERIPVEAGLKAGAVHEVRVFVMDVGGPARSTTKVVGPEEVEGADGTKVRLTRADTTLDVMPVVASAWVAPEGGSLRTKVEIAGMVIETLRTTKEKAQGSGTEVPVEVFTSSLIATRHLVPHPRLLDSALLRVKSKRSDRPLPSLADDRQAVERTEADGSVLLRVGRVVPPPGASGKRPLANPPADLVPYLASTSMLQADDPAIRSAMEEAVGGETDAWRAAQAIERWVHRAITKKNFDVAFASALEVCRDRQGDCTEHAVLAAALCRAAGIPSRVAMGLEYLTGILGGHAWTEVSIEGRWYAIDGTLGYGWADPLHLTLGRLALAEGTYAREFATFIESLSQLEVDVREATFAGRTTRFDAGAVSTEGGRYRNGPWGLAAGGPPGFTLEARGAAEGLSQRLADWKGAGKDGTPRRIRVRAESLPVDGGLAEAARMYGGGAPLQPAAIDGRPALLGDVGEGARRGRVAFVVDDVDSLFAFALEPAGTEEDRALFDAFLAGVDLDAEAPAPR